MKRVLPCVTCFIAICLSLSLPPLAQAETLSIKSFPKVMFEDDFASEKLNKKWKFYSALTEIKDGALNTKHKPGHGAVHGIHFKESFKDMAVSLRFRPMGKKSRVTVAFNDRMYKQVHAGHVCRVTITDNSILFQDDKFGIFNNKIWDKKKAGKPLSDEDKKIINSTKKQIKHTLSNDWHDLVVMVEGDVMQVNIDGKVIGSYKTKGNAHPTKRHMALVTGKELMMIDDVVLKGK